MDVKIARVFAGGLVLALGPLVLLGGLMLHTETTIAPPSPGETVALQRLVYRARFEARVSSVRLERRTEEGADPLVAQWIFAGSNTDGQVHRVEMQVRLLDEAGKQIGWFVAKHPLAAGAREQSFAVPMKVKAEVWKATKRVRIFAFWARLPHKYSCRAFRRSN
jgi:hypothetical protein